MADFGSSLIAEDKELAGVGPLRSTRPTLGQPAIHPFPRLQSFFRLPDRGTVGTV